MSLMSRFLEHTNFFACLCDVAPSGKSINITSALMRVWPDHPTQESDGCLRVCIDLWPTAYRFRRGHCIRLQVSSGADLSRSSSSIRSHPPCRLRMCRR